MSIPLLFAKRGFHPRQLFSALQGAWLEPTVGNIFTDTAGTSAITTGGQAIARINDQSGGGNNATQSTAANRPVLGRRYNLLTYSEDFSNAAWTKLNILSFGSGSVANAEVAPDGTTTADLIVPDTTSGQHGVYIGTSAVAGTTYTHSVYAKAGGYNWLYMLEGNNVTAQASFNLATGVLGTVSGSGSPSATITNVGNGWYRCALTLTPIAALQNIQIRAANGNGGGSYTGNGTSGIYIWGADLRLTSDIGKDPAYQRITTATDYDYGQYPAAVHDTTDSLSVSLPAINVRRNLLTYSEQFDNAAWVKQGLGTASTAVVTKDYGLAPDGTATADRLQLALNSGTTTSDFSRAYQGVAFLADTYSLSYYLKTTDGTTKTLGIRITSSTIQSVIVTSSWQRFTITRSTAAGGSSISLGLWGGSGHSDSADILVWGAQLELGSVATDYQKITDWTSEAYASSGSVYFATPVGMSALHNQSMGTSYTLPALSTDIYSWVVVPQRLSTVLENRLARYMERKAGIAGPDYFEQVDYGPELVVNGDFSQGSTGWTENNIGTGTFTVVGGQAVLSFDTSANRGRITQQTTVTSGKTYEFRFTVVSGLLNFNVGTTNSGFDVVFYNGLAPGVYVYYQKAQATNWITFAPNSGSVSASIVDNISVRELKDGMTGQLLDDNYEPLLMG